MTRARCPSCGGQVEFQSRISLYAVCPYCSSLVLRKDLDLEKIGSIAELQEDGTPLQLGTRGRYQGRAFTLIGRIQLQFPTGYWNEWYLSFASGSDGWLGEAQGRYGVNFLTPVKEPIPRFDTLHAGTRVTLAGETFEVTDRESARCIGGEGELPFAIESGYEAPVVDLSTPGRRFATLDYSEDPPLVFIGEWLEFDELAFTDLRTLEGW